MPVRPPRALLMSLLATAVVVVGRGGGGMDTAHIDTNGSIAGYNHAMGNRER